MSTLFVAGRPQLESIYMSLRRNLTIKFYWLETLFPATATLQPARVIGRKTDSSAYNR